jgi:aspartyl-tRNA(Asn)/glutamyl-tRNA(Gln) amidotransferase subunit A
MRREVSSRELVEHVVRAAVELQPTLNAFTILFPDRAMTAAREADEAIARGQTLASLHGIPFVAKDAFDVSGVVTSGCSRAYAERVATRDATAVAALRGAGMILVGKTNMHELGLLDTTSVSSYGPCRNPWDPARSPGGSSGGSAAAVAARIAPLALAEDTGGSIRSPASVCGVSGLKPTRGRVSTEGVLPISPTLDTAGPIATDVVDLTLAFASLTPFKPDRRDSLDGVRVGIPRDYFFTVVDPEVDAAVRAAADALEALGAGVRHVSLPGLEEANGIWIAIAAFEFTREHPGLGERLGELDPTTAWFVEFSARFTEDQYREAIAGAERIDRLFAEWFRDVDVLVAPATPIPAPRHDEETVRAGEVELSTRAGALSGQAFPASVAGLPALVVPCGFSRGGLPFGMQLIGPRGSESLLLAAGRLYQRETDWHTRVPPHAAQPI